MVTHEAENVVLADARPEQGRARVLESWRGDLAAGTWLCVPELATIASDSARVGYDTRGNALRAPIATDRAVLFLRKADGHWTFARGASLSFVLIDGGHVYAPSLSNTYGALGDLGVDETQLRARIAFAGERVDALRAAQIEPNDAKRAEKLVAILTAPGPWRIQWEARQSLVKCGQDAVPVLRKLLARRSLTEHHASLLQLLTEIAPIDARADVQRALEDDLRFWRLSARTFEEGWIRGAGLAGNDEIAYVQARIQRTRVALAFAESRGAVPAARAVRDLWHTDPLLAPQQTCVGLRP